MTELSRPEDWFWDHLLVMVIVAFIAVLAICAAFIVPLEIHRHHLMTVCHHHGGVWINGRGVHQCLYGVRTKP